MFLLRPQVLKQRADLKLVVMSATLEAEKFQVRRAARCAALCCAVLCCVLLRPLCHIVTLCAGSSGEAAVQNQNEPSLRRMTSHCPPCPPACPPHPARATSWTLP